MTIFVDTSLPGSLKLANGFPLAGKPAAVPVAASVPPREGSPARESLSISPLAQQLVESAQRADVRDQSLDRSALRERAEALLQPILGDTYDRNKARNDAQLPATSDVARLAQARQATAFVSDHIRGGQSEKNPFAGLSREQLANITYDDSGSFTINERRAAYEEAAKQEFAFRVELSAKAIAEYNDSGKLTEFFKAAMAYFNDLPKIEQAQYPDDYASDLQQKIRDDVNYRTGQKGAGGQGADNVNNQSLQERSANHLAEINLTNLLASLPNTAFFSRQKPN